MGIRTDVAETSQNARPQTVLIIDDDRAYAGLVAEILEMTGLSTQRAHSGEDGLAAARRHQPDLILLDVQMTGISGYETCRRLKADSAIADTPVLFMSGHADIEDKLRGFDVGGLDYIPKPFQRLELLARVRTHLKIREQSRLLKTQAFELGIAHDALEQRVEMRTAALRESQSELTARLHELGALNKIAHVIASTENLGEMLQQVLEATLLLPILKLQGKGAIFLMDESNPGWLVREASVGLAPFLVEAEPRIPFGHCLCGACAVAGKTIVTTGSCAAEHAVQYPGILDHGHVVLPLRSQHGHLGVMTLYLEPGVQPGESEVRLLEGIAGQIGMAVENRRLFRDIAAGKKEWEQTFDAIADLVTINGLDHRVRRLNAAAARVFGGYQDSIGREFYELPGDEKFAEYCRLAPELSAVPPVVTIRGRQYDTRVFPIEEQGELQGFVFVAKDVTERNLAEKALREHQAFTDNLLQSTAAAMFVINARHEVIVWNRACEELTGFPAAAMLGSTGQWRPFYEKSRPVLADLVFEGYSDTYAALYDKVSKSVLLAEGLRAEGWYPDLNGQRRYIVFDAAPIRDSEGTVIAAVETLQDITMRKSGEEEIAASEARYRLILENAHDMIQSVAPDGRILYANPAWLRTLGYTREDLAGLTIFDVLDPDSQAHCRGVFERLMSGRPVDFFEVTYVARDGSVIAAEGSATVSVADGRVTSSQAILHDVTERRRLAEISKEQMHITEFERDVGAILNSGESIKNVLKACTDAVVHHLDAAFARIWTVDDTGTMLEMQASSGMYTHTDGPHGRLPIAKAAKIPLIAATGKPNLTNSIVGDPTVTEQEWAIREGMVSFAGYPLAVEGRVLGVLGMFSRKSLGERVLAALEFVAGNIALGIARARSVERLALYSSELTALNAASGRLMIADNLPETYQQICEIGLAVFDMRMCWLGLVEPGTRDVRPVAHAGHENGYLEAIRVRWDDSPLGRGPSGMAIKTRTARRSTVTDPDFGSWSEEALQRGYRASLAVPLIAREECIGVLNFYSGDSEHFTADRVKLCQVFGNQAAIAIENARLVEGLEATVGERTRNLEESNRVVQAINRELELRRQDSEAANRAKSDFLANMSHELRTPLNAIIGFSDLMARGMAGPLAGDQKEYVGDILTSGRHLLSLINDILDLSKVEAGRMEFEPAEFDLGELVGSSLSMFREKALKHGIRLEAHLAAGAAPVYADERKIKQIVFNLLSNALKFTPDGGAVCVRTAATGENGDAHVEISVTDTGIGMTPEDQKQLFQPFKQLRHHLTKQQEGTGLGLALCRKFVELHNGSISVESAPGQGSTFTVRLPLRADLLAARGQI